MEGDVAMRVLQVCNVGRIVGGTAACAWTVARSLPACEHTVASLSRVSEDTRRAFAGCRVVAWDRVMAEHVREIDPDVVLLHNTSRSRVEGRLPAVTLQYLHSRIDPAPADRTLYCSAWLAEQYGGSSKDVLLQAVPRPRRPEEAGGETRELRESPVIGRLCTPTRAKWPDDIVPFYAGLASRFREVRWEFVGCPEGLQTALRSACSGRAEFFPAGWAMRSRLWHWDVLLYHNAAVTESFGRTVAEAMRAGCVPIVDGRGGFREQVEPACGFLCGGPEEFAEAVARIHTPAARRRMSRACQAHANERFSLARFGAELLERLRMAAAI